MNFNSQNVVKLSASLASVGATSTHACDGAGSALVQVTSHSSVVGAQFVAEVQTSDNAPWCLSHIMPTNDATPGTPITTTAAFTGIPTFGWRVDLQGASSVRFRVTTLGSGSFVLQSKLSPIAYA